METNTIHGFDIHTQDFKDLIYIIKWKPKRSIYLICMSLDQFYVWICDEMLKFRHSSMVANAEEMVDMDQDR